MISDEAVEATEPQPEPCEYCSVIAGELKVCDRTCKDLTHEDWIELTSNQDRKAA